MPAQANDAIRLTHIGTLAQGEEFNFSLWVNVGVGVPLVQGNLDAFTTTVATLCKNLFVNDNLANNTIALLNTDSAYSKIRAYYYPGGSNVATLISEGDITRQGVGTNSLPDQCSLVVSLRSAVPSRSGRGRIYLPANGVLLQSHQVPSSLIGGVGDAFKNYVEAVNGTAAGGRDATVAVRSNTQGVMRNVEKAVIDSRIDIQRRRANSQTVVASIQRTITTF